MRRIDDIYSLYSHFISALLYADSLTWCKELLNHKCNVAKKRIILSLTLSLYHNSRTEFIVVHTMYTYLPARNSIPTFYNYEFCFLFPALLGELILKLRPTTELACIFFCQ